jgi:hypothetical protein
LNRRKPKSKKGSGPKEQPDVPVQGTSLPPSSTAPSAEVAATLPDGKTADKPVDMVLVRALQKNLQKQLGREVSVPGEGRFRKAARVVATNPYLVLGAYTVGVGVAGVLTAGTAHLVLGAIGAGQLSSSGSNVIDRWKSKKQGTVYLDQSAVEYLLKMELPDSRVRVVQAALSATPPGDVSIIAQQLTEAAAKLDADLRMGRTRLSRLVGTLRSPYGRAGLALLSAGLFLIAVTVIPEYIHDPSLRVAVAVSAIGGILISMAVIEEFRNTLTGSSDLSTGR